MTADYISTMQEKFGESWKWLMKKQEK
jgi:hypothetical protein